MQRIVKVFDHDGKSVRIAFEGTVVPDAYDVVVWEGNGHREISARQVIAWEEIGPAPDWSHLLEPDPARDAAIEADRKEKNLLRAARRAKSACRRFIKTMGFDELLTLTYRENQTDEELCKKHAAAFFRKMGALVDGFGYCAGYETQKRGAWHVHAAVYKLPEFLTIKKRMPNGEWRAFRMESWRVGTAVWRSIVGKDNGMCFLGGKGPRAKTARRSLAKMAAYVSKYITKHYEAVPDGKNRYTHSQGLQVPKCQRVRLVGVSLLDIINRCFWLDDGEHVVDHRIGHFKDSYYLCTERPPGEVREDLT